MDRREIIPDDPGGARFAFPGLTTKCCAGSFGVPQDLARLPVEAAFGGPEATQIRRDPVSR